MDIIKTNDKQEGVIEVSTTDDYTGEGLEEMRLEIKTIYSSAWINLTPEKVKALIDKLSKWVDD